MLNNLRQRVSEVLHELLMDSDSDPEPDELDLTQFVPQTRLSRFWHVVASAHRRETFVRDGYLRFCVPSVERESPT